MTLYTHPVSKAEHAQPVPLTYEQRMRCRLFLQLSPEETAHIILPRGLRLCSGLHIKADDGSVLRIETAEEEVSVVEADDAALGRACYHLGNRHVPASISAGCVSYPRDPVIDEMMKGLGFDVIHRFRPFEPESAAYDGSTHHRSPWEPH